MSIICLNCCKLGDPEVVNKLGKFVWRQSPSLFFLSETKRSASEMENVKKKIKGYKGAVADARRRYGGVVLLWQKGLNVSLLTMSLHHVDVIIHDFGGSQEWYFIGLYDY